MIYKVISKTEFRKFIDAIVKQNTAYGPRQVDTGIGGKPIYQFTAVKSADEIDFDYSVTHFSAKHFFLPFRDELSRFNF
ncbi:MAG: hydrogenase, partial [Chlorobiaceae bacterium]